LDFAIELENLTKIFPGKREIRALDNVSFKIKRNTAVGYLGPNGAGKTTTIKILTNILKPTSGIARIYDKDIRRDPMKALQACGTILEVPEFYPYLTPRETMVYLGKLRGMNQQYITRRIKEVMEEVEMSEWVDEKIGKFSTGMKQRTAIAQAMLHEPPLLILDEPTNGLDPKAMAHIRSLIKKLKMDRTVFLSSHLLNEVEQIVDAVILINRGKVLAFDDLTKIQQMLKATQIQVNFLEAIDENTIKKIKNLNEVQKLLQDNNSLLLSYDGTKKSAAAILDFLIKDLNLKVTTFHPLEKGLEDFYIELIDKDDFQKGGKSFES
jgi:ABC-2 type transport system ATP-binding protein